MPFAFVRTDHRNRANDQQLSHVTLTHFGNPAKPVFATGRVLSRHQAEPSSEIAAFAKVLCGRAKCLDRHRRHWPNTWHGLHAPRICVLQCAFLDFHLQVRHFDIYGFDLAQIGFGHLGNSFRRASELITTALGKGLPVSSLLRQDGPIFGQMCPNRIYELGALTDEQFAGAKQHGLGLLCFIFDGDGPHRWSRRSLRNGFSVNRIVLVAFDKGFHIKWRQEPNLMTGGARHTTPVMRRSARFHSDNAGRQLAERFLELSSRQFLPEFYITSLTGTADRERALGQINAQNEQVFHVSCSSLQPVWVATVQM
mmetsp:Transcript_18371/g.29659  ORF Transcript_18371/g.29659 Transcript_18371/m.29659 type:complete len:311 (-) Transcript_18371:283-1215(-)